MIGKYPYSDSFPISNCYNENIPGNRKQPAAYCINSSTGMLMAALSDKDAETVRSLISDCDIVHVDCGHAIHAERPGEFINCINNHIEQI